MFAKLHFNSNVKIATISDIHLSSRDSRTVPCLFNDIELATHLQDLSSSNDLVILNGDIFELLHPKLLPFSYKRELNQIKRTYPKTFFEIKDNKKILFIKGNHDHAVIIEGKSLYLGVEIVTPYGNLWFEHGHRGINLFQPAEIIDFCIGWMRRLLGYDTSLLIETFFERNIKGTSFSNGSVNNFIRIAREKFKTNPDIKAVIYGHLHRPNNLILYEDTPIGQLVICPDYRGFLDTTFIEIDKEGNVLAYTEEPNKLPIKEIYI